MQQYPPGTQNNYVGFLNLFIVMEIGKEQNVQKDRRGSKGSGISFADSDDRGFPLSFIGVNIQGCIHR